jgi:hypothetical protein
MRDFIRIKLGTTMLDCPIYWKNFIKMCQEKHNLSTQVDVPILLIQTELKPYYARYIVDYINYKPKEFIEFESENYLAFFILKFS